MGTETETPIQKAEDVAKNAVTSASTWVANGHVMVVVYAILAIVIIVGYNVIKDLRSELAQQKATTGTLAMQFAKVGEAYTGQGAIIKSNHEAEAKAIQLQGEQLNTAMVRQGNQVQAILEAHGRVISEFLKGGATQPVPVTPDGGFTGAQMVQKRSSGPALTDVTLAWNPKHPDPTQRLTGMWSTYREDYDTSAITWQKTADRSYAGTFRLKRSVYRPDPANPGQFILVGTEEIPLASATASFKIPDPTVILSRWGLVGGAVYDPVKHTWGPGAGLSYRVTDHLGVLTGFAGDRAFLWGSYTFGK